MHEPSYVSGFLLWTTIIKTRERLGVDLAALTTIAYIQKERLYQLLWMLYIEEAVKPIKTFYIYM